MIIQPKRFLTLSSQTQRKLFVMEQQVAEFSQCQYSIELIAGLLKSGNKTTFNISLK